MYSDNNLNKITNITNANTIVGYDKFQLIDTLINTSTGSLEFHSSLNSSFIEDIL